MRARAVAALVVLALAMGGGAAVASVTRTARAHEAAVASAAAHRLAARTAADVRRARGDTGGLQDPVATAAPPASSARPVRLRIPSIGVDSALERLQRDSRGVLEAPHYADEAGWFAQGVVPGRQGAAVLVGHVDTIQGPAVFVDLRRLRPGDRIVVTMSDGSTVRFRVDGSRVVQKALFPSDDVYGPTPDAQLRLITCSEPFDPVAKSYTDNLVLFATKV